MNILCVFPLLVVFTLCESVHKTRQAPASINNVGKFGRDTVRRIELPRRQRDEANKIGASLKRNRSFGDSLRPDLEIKPLSFGNIIENPLSVNPSRPEQLHQGFGKVPKDCSNKVAWRSPLLDCPSQVSSNLPSLNVDSSYNEALKDKFKFANIDFKNRVEDNVARFSEPNRNYSDGPFQQPESLKVNSQIKDLISQSLFAMPIKSDSPKTLKIHSLSNIGINEGPINPPSNSISLKILLNKNVSDILSLSKPDLPTKTSLTIMRNKNSDVKPFQLLTQGGKLVDKIDQTQMDRLAKKSDEQILEKQNYIYINDLLKNKNADPNSAAEKGAIKSARRLFDVIQSQNPLDLLNIPLLMNSFKLGPTGLSSKVSSAKLGSSPLIPVANQNEAISIALPALTTQKSAIPERNVAKENEKFVVSPLDSKIFETTVSKPLSLFLSGNHSFANNYLPWGPLSSILTQSLPNMPLILIPLNKIRLGSAMTSPEKDSLELKFNNKEINKTLEPLAEEMRKVFNYQDMFSKHFNDFNLKDLIDFGSSIQKSEQKTGESLNLLSIPSFKKHDEMEFQKRVEDFLKLSRLNASNFHLKLDVTEKSEPPPDEEALKTLGFTGTSNSTRLTQEAKKSMFHDRVSILPLLKVTANMALSKYSNIPRFDKQMLDDITGKKGNVSSNQLEATRSPISWTLPPMAYINIENSSMNTIAKGSYITEINSAISTEASFDKRLNELDGPVLENSSTSIGLTDVPFIPRAEAVKKNESQELFPASDPMSFVMKSAANNFILQTIKEFEQTLKLDPKSLGLDTLIQTNSSHETNQSNSKESERVDLEDNSLSINGTSLNITQPTTKTNEFVSSDNHTFSDGKTSVESKNDDCNQNSDDDLSHKHLSKEEETSMSSLNVLGSEIDSTLTTDNVNPENKSTESFPQDTSNSVHNIILENSLLSRNNIKANWAQVKKMLSAALNDETKGSFKYKTNLVLQNYANSASELSPSEISDVNMNQPLLSVENSQRTTPEVMVSHVPKKNNGFEYCDSESPILGNASYYMSNKTRQDVEKFRNKDVKNEAFQIPAVLIEILNRMESTVMNSPGGTGYNMLFVPAHKNETQNIKPTEDRDHFEAMPHSIDTSDIADISVKGSLTPITLTTEYPAYTKPDNIYQVVTMKNDSERGCKDKIIFNTPTPKIEDCILLHNDVAEKKEPTYDGKSVHKPFSPFHNNRPIILVAIDPLKAWEGQSSSERRSMGYMPLGIIIKSTSVFSKPELNEPIVRGGTSLIGEVPQNCAEFKCTTACPVESCKCKEVTLFPIYPMYPVYPLKPIIATNNTTALTAKTN